MWFMVFMTRCGSRSHKTRLPVSIISINGVSPKKSAPPSLLITYKLQYATRSPQQLLFSSSCRLKYFSYLSFQWISLVLVIFCYASATSLLIMRHFDLIAIASPERKWNSDLQANDYNLLMMMHLMQEQNIICNCVNCIGTCCMDDWYRQSCNHQ